MPDNSDKSRKLLLKISIAMFVTGLLIVLRSIFYQDVSILLGITAISLLLLAFGGQFLSGTARKNALPGKKPDNAENTAKRTYQSILPFSSPDSALQHFLHLINPDCPLKTKISMALRQLPEFFGNCRFLYFSIDDDQIRFIAGSQKNQRGLCENITERDSLVDDASRKIHGCIDIRAIKKTAGFVAPMAFDNNDGSEHGLLLSVAFAERLHGIMVATGPLAPGFSQQQKSMLGDFCNGLALVLENHDLFFDNRSRNEAEAENKLADKLFHRILPDHPPQLRGWDIAQIANYSEEHSGDFHLFLNQPGERTLLLFGKCSGKGLNAALFLDKFHTMLHCLLDRCQTPAELLNQTSRCMTAENMTDLFATAAAVQIKAGDRSVQLAMAGHAMPLINRSRSGYVEVPQLESGVPLGLFNQGLEPYKNQTIQLLPGDGILFYTEGVTEFPAYGRERVSLEELRQMLDKLPEESAKVMLANLAQQLNPAKTQLRPVEDHTLIYAKSE